MSVVSSNILAGTSGQATDSYEIKKGLRFNNSDGAVLKRTPSTAGNRRTWTYSCWFKRSAKGSSLYQHLIDANDGSTYFDAQIYPDGEIGIFYNPSSSQYVVPSALYRDFSAWYHFVLAIDTTQTTDSDRVKIYINGVRETEFGTSSWPAQDAELMINSTAEHEIGGRNGTEYFGGYMADSYLIDGSAVEASVFGEFDTDGIWQPKKVTEAALITAKQSQQPYNTRDNMAQEWSSNFTSSTGSFFSGQGPTLAFNGLTGAGQESNPSASSGTLTFTPSGGIAYASSIEVMVAATGNRSVVINGGSPIIVSTVDQYVTVATGSGTLNSLSVDGTASANWPALKAIRIDGRVLKDGPADNSQLWSATAIRSDWAAANPASQLFDGSLSTYTYSLGGSYEQITWDAITATSSVEVYGRGTTDSWRMIIDGSPVSVVFSGNTVSDNSWRTVSTSFPCSVTGIENNNPGACYAVRIDGKILVNAPSKYNASKTWSEYLSAPPGFNSGRYPDRAFVGTDSSDFAATPANVSGESNAIEFTPPTTIAYTTLEVRGRGTDQTTFSVKIDTGSGYGSAITSTGDKWQTIATSGTLTKLKLWTTSFAGENELGGIRIDGKVLVDGGWGTNGFHLAFDDGTDIGKDTAVTAPALDPRGGFDAVLYTGNGASTPGGSGNSQTINDFRFKPDLLIIKQRDYAHDWNVVDSIRQAPNLLLTNSTSAEITNSTDGVLDLNVDGFTLGPNSVGTQSMEINKSGQSYVSYGWKAGGPAVSNSDGTITSTVSADQNYGFSVVKYTGTGAAATVGHGLSAAPKLILCKTRSSATQWVVYHVTTGKDAYLGLNTTDAATTFSSYWGAGTTSTTFGLQAASGGNNSGDMIAYCWSEVAGFSKMGTYAGSSNAVTVNTGFAPKFILIKSNDTSGQEWIIKDKTLGFDKYLIPNNSDAEATGRNVTFNSDGFTVDSGQGPTNWSGRNYIYVAFADYPANNFTPQNLITEENTASKNNFGTFTWTGNSTAGTVIETGFQPDLVWVKDRGVADVAGLFDSVRGSTKYLIPSTTGQEGTDANAITSFTSSGFTLGTGYTSITTNYSGRNLVGWAWKAGGAASANTDGNVTAQVSANPNFGFSICNYTVGENATNTIGHGLTKPPEFIILKEEDQTNHWQVYHKALGNAKVIYLDLTNGNSPNTVWNSTSPTSSVFTVQSGGSSNAWNNKTQIAYCWHSVDGYSRFSSYVGNGSSTGPVIDCGFKPAFVLIKETSQSGQAWMMHDTDRGGNIYIQANASSAESTYTSVEFTDTGFNIKTSDNGWNRSGSTYIYAAFAEPAYGDLDLVNDTPTANAEDPVKGNYATLNAIDSNIGANLTNGNLAAAGSSNWSAGHARGTFRLTSGKWYWEVTMTGGSGSTAQIGFCNKAFSLTTSYGSLPADSWTFNFGNGTEILMPSGGGGSYFSGSAMVSGDVAGIALDMDAGTAIFYKNNVAGATISLSSTKTGSTNNITELFPLVGVYTANVSANFGQQPFKYTPPTGYKSLCTTNLPDPTITDGSTAFDTKLFTGTHPTGQSITGYNFSPDFVWLKDRASTNWHYLFDAIRGTEKGMFSNATNAEGTYANTLTAFNSDGFTLGSDNATNQNGNAYVAWAWDAGTSNTSISAGSLNSTAYNTSAVWSDALTASTLKTATAGFNGDISSGRSEGTGGLTFTPSGGISVSSSVEVYDNNSVTKSRVTVNNVQQSDVQHVSGNWVTVFTGSGTLNSLYNERTDNSGWDAGFYALRIDGKILVDSNITPANVPVLASTVRANPTAGFSVVSWTGARNAGDTVAHGLNAAPELVIVKNRDQSTNWMTYHKSSGAAGYLALNLNNAYAAASTVWNSTAPDSSVFTLGADSESNGDGDDMITYCFAPVEGYSSFGSYTGNGSTDGPFVCTGFRPAFIMIKRTDSTGWWEMWDSSRNEYNEVDNVLAANASDAEFTGSATGDRFDFLANGFRVRCSNNDVNASGGSFAYVCFAENPFKTARAR